MNLSVIVGEWQHRMNFAQIVSFAVVRLAQGISPEGVYAEVMTRFGPPPEQQDSSVLSTMEKAGQK